MAGDIFFTRFQGGLSTRMSEDRISQDELQTAENLLVRDGTLRARDNISSSSALSGTTASVAMCKTGTNPQQFTYANVFGVEFKGWFYYSYLTNAGRPKKRRLSTGTDYDVGIDYPTTAPTAATGAGGLTLTGCLWRYTYVNDSDPENVIEGAPSDATASTDLTAQKGVITVKYSADAQVTKIYLYRLSQTTAQYQYVTSITNVTGTSTTTIDDNVAVASLGATLGSTNYSVPESATDGLAGTYNGMMIAWKGKRTYWCVPGRPDAWPTNYYKDWPYDVMAVVVLGQNGWLVLTTNTVHLVTGTSPTAFWFTDVDQTVGCIAGNTAAVTPMGAMWVSQYGVSRYANSGVEHITRPKVASLLSDALYATWADGQYMVFANAGTTIVDFLNGAPSTVTCTHVATHGVASYDGDAYYIKDVSGTRALYKIGRSAAGTPVALTFTAKTRAFMPKNLSNKLHVRKVSADYIGNLTLKVYADGVLNDTIVLPKQLTRRERATFTKASIWGQRITLEAVGDDEVWHLGLIGVEEVGGGK